MDGENTTIKHRRLAVYCKDCTRWRKERTYEERQIVFGRCRYTGHTVNEHHSCPQGCRK